MSDAQFRLLIQRSFDEELTKQEHRSLLNHLETSEMGQKFHHQLEQMIQAAQDTPLPDELHPQNPEALAKLIIEQLPQKKGGLLSVIQNLFAGFTKSAPAASKSKGALKPAAGKKAAGKGKVKPEPEPAAAKGKAGSMFRKAPQEPDAEEIETQAGAVSRLKSIGARGELQDNRESQSTTRSLGEKFGIAGSGSGNLEDGPLTLAESIRRKVSESQKLSPVETENTETFEETNLTGQAKPSYAGFAPPADLDTSEGWASGLSTPERAAPKSPLNNPEPASSWLAAPAQMPQAPRGPHHGSAIGLAAPGSQPAQTTPAWGTAPAGSADAQAGASASSGAAPGWGHAAAASPSPAPAEGGGWGNAPDNSWGSGWNSPEAKGRTPLKSSDSWAMPGQEGGWEDAASSSTPSPAAQQAPATQAGWGNEPVTTQESALGGVGQTTSDKGGWSSAESWSAPGQAKPAAAQFTTNTGGWGQNAEPAAPSTASTGGWGQQAEPAAPSTASTGGWGQKAEPTAPSTASTGAWGQQAEPAAPAAQPTINTGAWGQQAEPSAPSTASTGGWGQQAEPTAPSAQPTTNTAAWGQQAEPTAPSAQPTTNTGAWGQQAEPNAPAAQPTTNTGGWGQQASSTGGWGQSPTPTPAQAQVPPSAGGWGQTAPASPASAGGWGQAVDASEKQRPSWSMEAEQMETGTWRAFTPASAAGTLGAKAPASPPAPAAAPTPAIPAGKPASDDRWDLPIQERIKLQNQEAQVSQQQAGAISRFDMPIQERAQAIEPSASFSPPQTPQPTAPVETSGIPVNQIVEKMGEVLSGSQTAQAASAKAPDNRWDVPIQERIKQQAAVEPPAIATPPSLPPSQPPLTPPVVTPSGWGAAPIPAPIPVVPTPAQTNLNRGMFNLDDSAMDKIFNDNLGIQDKPLTASAPQPAPEPKAPVAQPVSPVAEQPPAPAPAPAIIPTPIASKGLFNLSDSDLDAVFQQNLGIQDKALTKTEPAQEAVAAPTAQSNFAPEPPASSGGWGVPSPLPTTPSAPAPSGWGQPEPVSSPSAPAPSGWGQPEPVSSPSAPAPSGWGQPEPVSSPSAPAPSGWGQTPIAPPSNVPSGWGQTPAQVPLAEPTTGVNAPSGWAQAPSVPSAGAPSGWAQPSPSPAASDWAQAAPPSPSGWAQTPPPIPAAETAAPPTPTPLFSVDDQVMNRIFSEAQPAAAPAVVEEETFQIQPPPKIAGIGRLDASADTANDTGSGRIAAIGKFLLDQKDLDKIGKLTSSDNADGKLRILTSEASNDLQALLGQIGSQQGVLGSVIVGHDGLLIANTMPGDMDAESVGVWALGVYMNTEHVTKKMGHERVHQVVSRTPKGYVVIADFGGGLLVTVTEGQTTDLLIPLMRTITQLVN